MTHEGHDVLILKVQFPQGWAATEARAKQKGTFLWVDRTCLCPLPLQQRPQRPRLRDSLPSRSLPVHSGRPSDHFSKLELSSVCLGALHTPT